MRTGPEKLDSEHNWASCLIVARLQQAGANITRRAHQNQSPAFKARAASTTVDGEQTRSLSRKSGRDLAALRLVAAGQFQPDDGCRRQEGAAVLNVSGQVSPRLVTAGVAAAASKLRVSLLGAAG